MRNNDGLLLVDPWKQIPVKFEQFSKKLNMEVSSGKWHPFCVSLNVLSHRFAPAHGETIVECPLLSYGSGGL